LGTIGKVERGKPESVKRLRGSVYEKSSLAKKTSGPPV